MPYRDPAAKKALVQRLRDENRGSGSRTHNSWESMLQRCRNPKFHKYPTYGGRGITVCERWLSFDNFLADMGERPEGMTLDRRDSDSNYEPSNCKWSTSAEQAANRRKPYSLTPRA